MTLHLLAIAVAAAGQGAPATAPAAAEPKVNQLIVYGEDVCPPSTDDEIIVCLKLPESERYRIPESLRGLDSPQAQSWVNRAIELSYVGRTGVGSCTPVGPGGFIGCFNQLAQQAVAERRGQEQGGWNLLIEKARQERLGRIDAEAEAIEQEQRERERNQPR